MDRRLIHVCALAMLAAACGDNAPAPERMCATDIAEGEVQQFGDSPEARSEGITFDQGSLFATTSLAEGNDRLLRFDTEGAFTVTAESESLLGLESAQVGILAAGIRTGELLVIDPESGDVSVLADDLGAPNFIVNTPWGTVLVSDDSFGEDAIDEVTLDGEVSTWVTGVPTPNGMVFSLDESTLYVATTFTEPGVWRVPVSVEGNAGTPELWIPFEEGSTPDGIAIDVDGNLYVALNLAGTIAKIDPEGNVTEDFAELSAPASLAFGQGAFDPCSLYVTSLSPEGRLSRVGTGVLGVERR
ncbi:MAG: SMP-30/gluconolactonase/LRE family protein [Myxococcota bacterium]